MGIDTKRFVNPLPQDFICPICNDVYDAPVQCPDEHIFCSDCIFKWNLKINRCPLDQKSLLFTELTPTPRVLRNLLDDLELRCEFSEYGCHTITTLESMKSHVMNCKFRSIMERRTVELKLLQVQNKELMDNVATMDSKTKLLNEALIETNSKLETATVAIDELQTQVVDRNCKLAQLEAKLENLEVTNKAQLNKFELELTVIHKLVGYLRASHQGIVNSESASASRRQHIAEITGKIAISLDKLTSKLNESSSSSSSF